MRGQWSTVKVTHQGAAPGAKSDVYDCLVHSTFTVSK